MLTDFQNFVTAVKTVNLWPNTSPPYIKHVAALVPYLDRGAFCERHCTTFGADDSRFHSGWICLRPANSCDFSVIDTSSMPSASLSVALTN